MLFKDWRKEICTVPNLLSVSRLILAPVFAILYRNAHSRQAQLAACGLLALSCLTDLLDGILARALGQVTLTGKVLDPLADKATQLTLLLCLLERHRILGGLLILFLAKELFQLYACLRCLRRGVMLPGALPVGKLCTAFLFLSLTALAILSPVPPLPAAIVALADGTLLALAMIRYGQAFNLEEE